MTFNLIEKEINESSEIFCSEIVHGEQIIFTISAMSGGVGESVLQEIANPKVSTVINKREFDEWKNGVCLGKIILNNGAEREVALKINVKEGLFLEDSSNKNFSLKHSCNGDLCIIPVPLLSHNIGVMANAIIGTWIVHGRNWIDRAGNKYFWAYGTDINRNKVYSFNIESGESYTLANALDSGVIRAAHVGTWTKSSTLVPIACGMTTLLHEFEEKSAGGNDITIIGDEKVSNDDNIWGPYARWLSDDFLKYDCISPFAAHIYYTIKRFENCTLSSTFLIDSIGEEKLFSILNILQEKLPQRYYRIIDEKGVTHRLDKVKDGIAFYGDIQFPVDELAENMIMTFKDLAKIEQDTFFSIPKVKRVVLDSHFFIVVMSMISARNGISHQMSGSEMFRYLINDSDVANMHRERNETLFNLLKNEFKLKKLKLIIYPASSIRLPNVNQYNFDFEKWNKQYWLEKVLKR